MIEYKSLHSRKSIRIFANMSRLLQPHIQILKKVACMREAKRHAYLKDCNWDIINCICMRAKNVFKKSSTVEGSVWSSEGKKLDIHKLANAKMPLKQKWCTLSQKGEFVTSLLVPAITALGFVLTSQLFPQSSAWYESRKMTVSPSLTRVQAPATSYSFLRKSMQCCTT